MNNEHMNYALIVIDYLLMTRNAAGQLDADAAHRFLYRFRERMTRDDYTRTADIIRRITDAASEKGGR